MLSPVDDEGKFTEEAGKFCGLDVLADGNSAVVKYLDEHLSIIMEESYRKFSPLSLSRSGNLLFPFPFSYSKLCQ